MHRRKWNDGQEITLEDLNALTKAIERGFFDNLVYRMLEKTTDAFFGSDFLVSRVTATSVSVAPGLGFQQDTSQSNPEPSIRPLYLPTAETVVLSAPDGSNDRIDIICVKAELESDLSANRKHKDAISSTVTTQSLTVQDKWQADAIKVDGTPAGSPVAPATPAGYLRIASVLVEAVTGIPAVAGITDERSKFPIGALMNLYTVGYDRLTAGASTPIQTLLDEIDAFLKNGYFEYTDLDDLSAEPASPALNKVRMYVKDDLAYLKNNGGSVTPIGSGGGGGGAMQFTAPDGYAPIVEEENEVDVMLFESGLDQKLTVFFKVPEGFISGRQIKAFFAHYSPSNSNTQLISVKSYLIRKNVDAVDSPISNRTSANTAITNTVANQLRHIEADVTTDVGQIDGYSVSAGDIIKLEIFRGTDTDTADIRFIETSMEVKSV